MYLISYTPYSLQGMSYSRAFNIFKVYQYFTIYRQYFLLKFEHLIQFSLKSGGTKDHFRQVPGTAPYWKACYSKLGKMCLNHFQTHHLLLITVPIYFELQKFTSSPARSTRIEFQLYLHQITCSIFLAPTLGNLSISTWHVLYWASVISTSFPF